MTLRLILKTKKYWSVRVLVTLSLINTWSYSNNVFSGNIFILSYLINTCLKWFATIKVFEKKKNPNIRYKDCLETFSLEKVSNGIYTSSICGLLTCQLECQSSLILRSQIYLVHSTVTLKQLILLLPSTQMTSNKVFPVEKLPCDRIKKW